EEGTCAADVCEQLAEESASVSDYHDSGRRLSQRGADHQHVSGVEGDGDVDRSDRAGYLRAKQRALSHGDEGVSSAGQSAADSGEPGVRAVSWREWICAV